VTVPHNTRVTVNAMRRFMEKAVAGGLRVRQVSQGEVDQGKLEVPQRHPHTGEVKETVRPLVFELPKLAELRELFDTTHGGPYEWREPGEYETPDPGAF
jgi:hypothetical protein